MAYSRSWPPVTKNPHVVPAIAVGRKPDTRAKLISKTAMPTYVIPIMSQGRDTSYVRETSTLPVAAPRFSSAARFAASNGENPRATIRDGNHPTRIQIAAEVKYAAVHNKSVRAARRSANRTEKKLAGARSTPGSANAADGAVSGSRAARTRANSNGPTPHTAKIALQPSPTPAVRNPNKLAPRGTPQNIFPTLPALRLLPETSEAIAINVGSNPPRPRPVIVRRTYSCARLPTTIVANDERPSTTIAAINTLLRPIRSDSLPPAVAPTNSPKVVRLNAKPNWVGRI